MDRFTHLKNTVTPLLQPYAKRIAVFGSFARGDQTEKSDIDLLISLKDSNKRPTLGLFEFISLEQELKRKLGCDVDLVKETFFEHLMMQDAVMHQIEIIGEASNRISDDFQEKHLELPWMQMRAIRNKIVHDYRGIELEIVWDTVKNNLPGLKVQVEHLLEDNDTD